MKIYKVRAKRTVEYFIAVKNDEDPREVAKSNEDEAFYDDAGEEVINVEEVDIFDPTLDNKEIYGLSDMIEDLREEARKEQGK